VTTVRSETAPSPPARRLEPELELLGIPMIFASGTAPSGQVRAESRGAHRQVTASSASWKSPSRRATAPRTCGASAQQVLDGDHRRPASITGRTSISLPIGVPPGPGAADVLAAISIARCSVSTSTSQ
jgi:hypothetical protein